MKAIGLCSCFLNFISMLGTFIDFRIKDEVLVLSFLNRHWDICRDPAAFGSDSALDSVFHYKSDQWSEGLIALSRVGEYIYVRNQGGVILFKPQELSRGGVILQGKMWLIFSRKRNRFWVIIIAGNYTVLISARHDWSDCLSYIKLFNHLNN